MPTIYRLLGLAASRGERIALVAATGAFLFIPKVLRDPNGPIYFDELAHWRQSETLSSTGQLFTPNSIVHFAQFFPGLDSVDVALHRLTGLSTFASATAMLAVVHVAALLGVFRLGERVLGSARLGRARRARLRPEFELHVLRLAVLVRVAGIPLLHLVGRVCGRGARAAPRRSTARLGRRRARLRDARASSRTT